jgi:hypothetical protein
VKVGVDVDACDHSFLAGRADPVVDFSDDLAHVDQDQAVLLQLLRAGEMSGEELDVPVRHKPAPQPPAEVGLPSVPGPARWGHGIGRSAGGGARDGARLGVGCGTEKGA